ncbi:hypothetical protein P3X46_002306 [Hevea brasiliensis]|uniref:C2HC zinc finger plants domain-containing protein n=1 Tax=Hevea brasiliensis TaxID=3981 RepID=A0ABQ9N507_HEVBR|nr:uncharacterized protein LOC110651030 isoform X1 [Hevea brasiliensis]KAJ9186769.1 hypothetical protein P3X46_002306 [Hevea brasiliensis]KAJ9186770.1 hypothetical protein P3X46_002306 [Hevea brasiliensis]
MPDAMDGKDTQMTDTETLTLTSAAVPHQVANDVVKEMLTLARQLINEGKPSQALQAVVVAIRTKGGDEAVFQSLNHARELYRNRLQENTAIDQLAAVFAECAIAEVQPSEVEPLPLNVGGPSLDVHANSILADTGRMQIVLDAFSDGSNFICLQCGGLVSNHRRDEHYAYWCCQL